MRSDLPAMLDACVLLPMPLADTLLRMAEEPRLYLPRWSNATLEEVTRNLTGKWNKTPVQAKNRERAMRKAFPEAQVFGYEHLISEMTNDAKDRHILAAAAASGTKRIVTYNAKHFPKESLERYGIECPGAVEVPDRFVRSRSRYRGAKDRRSSPECQSFSAGSPDQTTRQCSRFRVLPLRGAENCSS